MHRSPAANQERWAHQNRQGSVVALTNATGAVVDQFRYSPYGQPGTEGATGFPFRFTGQKLDAETGLYYYKARYYDPALGRFLQTDPVGYQDDLNLYAYVRNDPLNRTDPTGREAACVSLGVDCFGRDRPRDPVSSFEEMKDAVGTAADFLQNYRDMRDANAVGADAYFHCRANCEAAARGPTGESVARAISDAREAIDRATGDPPVATPPIKLLIDKVAEVLHKLPSGDARQRAPIFARRRCRVGLDICRLRPRRLQEQRPSRRHPRRRHLRR